MSAQTVLERLMDIAPGVFTDKHLRTVQRAVRSWRGERARLVIMGRWGRLAPRWRPLPRQRPPPANLL